MAKHHKRDESINYVSNNVELFVLQGCSLFPGDIVIENDQFHLVTMILNKAHHITYVTRICLNNLSTIIVDDLQWYITMKCD